MSINNRIVLLIMGVMAMASCPLTANSQENATIDKAVTPDTTVVYMTKEISPEAIIKLYKACTDLVRASNDHGKIHLIERIDSRHGMHTLEHAEKIGLGTQTYKIVTLD